MRRSALPVAVNREEIRQVLLNLLLNAEHAMTSKSGSSGTITVETYGGPSMQTVEVTDSGPGISPELRGRIFEPFFTTREVGEGTGLGLSISLGIASSHGGMLSLVDSPVGARFRLTLPAHSETTIVRPSEGAAALVVEADEATRKLIVRLLEKRGYSVTQAATADAAVALSHTKRPDIVICDTTVAGVSGVELVHRLAGPSTGGPPRFLFIAGEHATHLDEGSLAGLPVLSKPFTATELEEALVDAGMAAPSA